MFPLTATHYDKERRIWSGPKRKELYNENITLGEVIYEKFQQQPQKVIQIYDVTGEEMTCEQLLHSAECIAKNILNRGVKTGDVIGLYAGNTPYVASVMLASFLCGTPVNAVYPGFDKDNVSTIYKVTEPKLIFCDVENYQNAHSVNEELQLKASIFVMNGTVEGVASVKDLLNTESDKGNEYFRFPCFDLKGDDNAVILCSSGTTGPPKGVLLSHRAVFNQNVFLTLKSDSVLFSFSPIYWASGFWTLTSSLMNACLRIITDKDYTPEYYLSLVKRHKITHIVATVTQMTGVALLDDEAKTQDSFASIDTIVVGGAKVPMIIREKMNQILSCNLKRPGFAVAYGMTELGGALSSNGGYPTERLIGSEGKLTANMQVRILSKEGELLGPNERGEICICKPYPWSGYYRNVEATRKALVDNWLHTGDIGYFNDAGFLHICSRDSEVFKSRNFQIHPQSIEDIIMSVPGVFEVCVFGIPDLATSNLVACAVIRTADKEGLKLTAQEIEDHVRLNRDSTYHLSGGVYFLDAIPKTATGKMQRKKVLDIVLKIRQMNGVA